MTLQITEDLTSLLQTGEQSAEQAARELIVLELYRQHRVSGGKAAELLGTSREEFMTRAAAVKIPYIDMTDLEFDQEIEEAERLALEHRL
jgi:predicted HTH domain antitoxin